MIDVEQHMIQEAVKQVVELGQCQGKGIHCVDWQYVLIGPSHISFRERNKVLFVQCTQCGLAVRTPQS